MAGGGALSDLYPAMKQGQAPQPKRKEHQKVGQSIGGRPDATSSARSVRASESCGR